MKKFFNVRKSGFVITAAILCLTSLLLCKSKKKDKSKDKPEIVEIGTQKTDHTWYYFNN